MTVQEIKYKLRNDLDFLVSVIIANNPEAVRKNLAQIYDVNVESMEALQDVIMEFAEIGQEKLFSDILTVPFISSNATPELTQAYEEIQAEKLNGASGKFADWSGGMFSAIGGIAGGLLGGGQSSSQQPMYYPAPPPPKKDNTVIYIIAGVSILVVGIIAFKVLK